MSFEFKPGGRQGEQALPGVSSAALKFMAMSDSVRLEQIVKDLKFDKGGPPGRFLKGFIEHFNMRIDNFKIFAQWSNAAVGHTKRNIQLRYALRSFMSSKLFLYVIDLIHHPIFQVRNTIG